ncbi:LOG family protein [Aequorivita echinoideorum]|uniref:LOG family protein n=1 Tax=Aequorivita echinoideorum TaxID=1549647 RepID=UPI001FE97F87|nr:TIGR00730 family Rossman fold protein [Aequorivita echinoideorum]
MIEKLEKICVFCGSSDGNDPAITEAAIQLGKILAEKKITLVYGAAKIGVMGTLAKSVLDHNGKVIGIIPNFLKTKEVVHLGLTQLVTTQNMHERKLKMQEASNGFIALPGGMGTLEELFEILTWLQLGLHSKPVGLLNTNNFYSPLIEMLDTMVERKFLSEENRALVLVSSEIGELLQKMENFNPPPKPKWLNVERT